MQYLLKNFLYFFEVLGLIAIAIAAVWAGMQDVIQIITIRRVTLADLLMMFIYLEVLAMVGMYLKSGKLPIRMPIYIAMVALARYLVLDMKALSATDMLAIAATLLLLVIAVLGIRFGQRVYQYDDERSSPLGKDRDSY